MKVVIIDNRGGGTRLSEDARKLVNTADLTLYIEQDDVVRPVTGLMWRGKTIHTQLFYAQTEEEASAELAASHLANRVGKPRSEHNEEAAMSKARAVWDMMPPLPE